MAAGQSDTEFCPGAGGLPAAAGSVRPRQAGGPSVNGADSVEGAAGGAQSRANSQSGPPLGH